MVSQILSEFRRRIFQRLRGASVVRFSDSIGATMSYLCVKTMYILRRAGCAARVSARQRVFLSRNYTQSLSPNRVCLRLPTASTSPHRNHEYSDWDNSARNSEHFNFCSGSDSQYVCTTHAHAEQKPRRALSARLLEMQFKSQSNGTSIIPRNIPCECFVLVSNADDASCNFCCRVVEPPK